MCVSDIFYDIEHKNTVKVTEMVDQQNQRMAEHLHLTSKHITQ